MAPEAPTVLIMAAGEGTRMRSAMPKVMHPVCGRPMIAWPVLAAREAGAGRVCVIVSPDRDLTPALPDGTETIVQPEADGTGGAMRAAIEVIAEAEEVIVLSGDHPLLDAELIAGLVATHRAAEAAATVITVEMDEPGSYGRIVRDGDGNVESIVETKNPESVPPEILGIREVNTGTYCFAGDRFAAALTRIDNDNEAGEYYLGDVLPLLRHGGGVVAAHVAPSPNANLGVNNRADLALVAIEARRAILRRHMLAGVTVVDPASTWIDADVVLDADITIEPGTYLRGATSVGRDCVIGPGTTVVDSRIGAGARILHSYLIEAEVGEDCSVGPFAYLRPGARLGTGSKVGTFVEVKNSELGDGAKVPHLSYVGDAEIGAGANLGAGTITANYDGSRKHRTRVGPGARVGVDTALVAPVDVGEGAYTGAGAVIREDVPAGALGLSAVEQRNIEGYAEKRAQREAESPPEAEGAQDGPS